MAKWQRYILGIGALGAWAVLLGVSLVANFRFGWSLGSSEFDRQILGVSSIASDLLKAAAPVGFLYLMAQKRYHAAASIAAIGLVATVYSVIAATGFAAGNRFHAFYEAERQVKDTKYLERQLDRLEQKMDWSAADKALPVLKADLNTLTVNPLYRSTTFCNDVRSEPAVKYCQQVRSVEAKIASAEQHEKDLLQARADRDKLRTEGRTHSDASVEVLHKVTGISKEWTLIGLIALTVLLIELGSALGLTAALALLAPDGSTLKRAISLETLIGALRKGKEEPAEAAVLPEKPKPVNVPSPAAVARARAASFKTPTAGNIPDSRGWVKTRPYDPAIDGPLGRPVQRTA